MRALLFLFAFTTTFSSFSQEEEEGMPCTEAYDLLYQGDYRGLQDLVEKYEDGSCYKSYRSKRPMSRKWHPGFLIVAIVHALSPGTKVEYTLLSKTLKLYPTPARDSLITALVKHDVYYNKNLVTNYLVQFMSEGHNLGPDQEWVFQVMYDHASEGNRLSAMKQAFIADYRPFMDKVLGSGAWKERKMDLVDALMCSDRTSELGQLATRYGMKASDFEHWSSSTVLHELSRSRSLNIHCGAGPERYQGMVNAFHDLGVDLYREDRGGRTPLTMAITSHHTSMIKALLPYLEDVTHQDDYNRNYLHLAADAGMDWLVEELLEKGVPTDAKDKWGMRPVDYAHDWDVPTLRLLGGAIDPRAANSHDLMRWAWEPDSMTQEDLARAREIIASGNFDQEVVYSRDMGMDRKKGLADLAAERENWAIFSLLLEHGVEVDSWLESKLDDALDAALSNRDYKMARQVTGLYKYADKRLIDRFYRAIPDDGYSAYCDTLFQIARDRVMIPTRTSSGKYTFANVSGESIFDVPSYDEVKPYGQGFVAQVRSQAGWGLISLKGKNLVDCQYDSIHYLTSWEGHMGPQWLFIASKGPETHLIQIDKFISFDLEKSYELDSGLVLVGVMHTSSSAPYLIVSREGKLGLLSLAYRALSVKEPTVHDEIRYHHEVEVFAYRQGEYWALCPRSYSCRKRFKYLEYKVENGQVMVRKRKKWKLLEL